MADIFFASASVTQNATTSSGAHAIPGSITGGKAVARIVREDNSSRVFIKFSTSSSVSVTTSDGVELIPGVVESFLVPAVGYFAIITDTGDADVNVTIGQGQ
jgi:hypothetical protein